MSHAAPESDHDEVVRLTQASFADPGRASGRYGHRIRLLECSDAELDERFRRGDLGSEIRGHAGLVVVHAHADGTVWSDPARLPWETAPWIILRDQIPDDPDVPVDVVTIPGLVDRGGLVAAIDAHPGAAWALVALQRGSSRRGVADGLIAESATYSMLQGGPEFATWLAGRTGLRGPPRRRSDGPPVIVERDGGTLAITLHRPEVRNALDTTMRDALLESLAIARFDPSVSTVRVTGSGPDFCSGGDLDEFGTAPDPATAHRIRLSTSIGAVLHELRDRVSFEVHGASRGSGIELAAFAGRVAATGDSTFALPEVTMGLIPGAGGTVSIGRRVGRVRATTLALTGAIVDAPRALEWGLIDSIDS